MSSSSPRTLSLEVMINKQKSKVLFAEADSDFINVLLSFLTMPLGKVVRVLEKHNGEEASAIGSISSLYKSLSDLDIAHFSVRGAKEMLLNPESSFRAECRRLAVDVSDSAPNRYFVCQDENCLKPPEVNVSLYCDIVTCDCGKSLNRPLFTGGSPEAPVFINNRSSFIITDDLRLTPMTGIVQSLNNLDPAVIKGAELQTVTFGISEMKDLLQLCLTSTTPLTDMIIGKRQSSYTATPELHYFQNDESNTRKIALKVCLQKSTNKFLFAVATDDFMELLLSFLIIPVGGVEFLLGGNTGLKNIDNIYRSVSNAIDDMYFMTPDIKNRLINPKVSHGYISQNQFLPLSEEGPPKLYYKRTVFRYSSSFSFSEKSGTLVSLFKMIQELYVKKQTVCLITDDLTLRRHSLATSILIMNGLGIPPCDVKEMELHIGLKEALGILKVSLTSKTALTDALINPMLNGLPKAERMPKQER